MAGLEPTARSIQRALFARVDIAWLVFFRVAFGGIGLAEVWRYFDHGWIQRYWVTPEFFFSYLGFGWLRPWPGIGMELHFIALGVFSAGIMFGRFYRASAIGFFLGFGYVFLLDKANYLNHFYLLALISLLMTVLPANRAFSADVARRPELASQTVSAWCLWLMRAQVGIPYFYGGIAKLNGDWLRGEPIRDWLSSRGDFPLIGEFFVEEGMVYAFAWGGAALDLFVVPALLYRRTRPYAYAAAVAFHVANATLFQIGIFPWFMIAATTVFFEPDWARFKGQWISPPETHASALPGPSARRGVLAVLALYLGFQLLFPLRHFLYPGVVHWTEEGHRFSWHMKLRSKDATAVFHLRDPETGEAWTIHPAARLTRRQERKMSTRPDMIVQFAGYLAELHERETGRRPEVRALVHSTLNDRESALLIDPNANLAADRDRLTPKRWILPLRESARPGAEASSRARP